MNKHHQAYLKEVRNQFLNQHDIYLNTLHEAYNILQWRMGDQVHTPHMSDRLMFTQVGTKGEHKNTNNHQGTTPATLGSSTSNQNIQNNDTPIPGMDGRLHPTIHYYKCNELGHYASNCPELMNESREMGHTYLTIGTNRGTRGFSFSRVEEETIRIPKLWILLNNQSTINIFCNVDLLDNIHMAENTPR